MSGATPSGIEADVCKDIAERQQKGIAKYGVTVADNPLSQREWHQHAYEEALDLAIYLKRSLAEMPVVSINLTQRADTFLARCESTWNTCYPERRPWADIGDDARDEWVRVFSFFDATNACLSHGDGSATPTVEKS